MEAKIAELLSDNTALPVLFIGSGLSRRYLNLPDWEGLLKQYCVKPFEYYNDKAARACRDNPEMRLPTAADYIEEDFNERWYIDAALLYLALLVVSLTAFGFSFCFSSTEREFTLLSSVGCSGIVSVLVAWLLERSNDRIQGIKNTEILNCLLNGFDIGVKCEMQRAVT